MSMTHHGAHVRQQATSRQVVYKGDRVILVCDGYAAKAITSCSGAAMVMA